MKFKFVIVLVALAVSRAAAAEDKYPSAYPFSNEQEQYAKPWADLSLPEATPNYAYDGTDPGGYTALQMTCDMDSLYKTHGAGRFSPVYCAGFSMWRKNRHTSDKVSDLGSSAYVNCSLLGQYVNNEPMDVWIKSLFGMEGVASVIGPAYDKDGSTGKTWCTSEKDCCPEFYQGKKDGKDKLTDLAFFPAIAPDFVDTYSKEIVKYQCTDVTQMNTCFLWYRGASYCVGNFLSPTKRVTTLPCPDVYQRFVWSCKVRLTAKSKARMPEGLEMFEPESYISKLTATEYELAALVFFQSDHVCHPYSYYYPSQAKPTVVPPGSTNTSKGSSAVAASSVAASSVAASSVAATPTSATATQTSTAAASSKTVTDTQTSGVNLHFLGLSLLVIALSLM